MQAGCYGARTFIAKFLACVMRTRLQLTRKALHANGSVRIGRSLTLHDKPMQETYIRHLKSRDFSVTKLTKKKWSFRDMLYYENLGLWVTDDKNYGTFSKE